MWIHDSRRLSGRIRASTVFMLWRPAVCPSTCSTVRSAIHGVSSPAMTSPRRSSRLSSSSATSARVPSATNGFAVQYERAERVGAKGFVEVGATERHVEHRFAAADDHELRSGVEETLRGLALDPLDELFEGF